LQGQVLTVGDEVPDGLIGKNFAVFPWLGCDKPSCVYCGEGWTNLCDSPDTTKFADGRSMYGGYSSHVLVPHYRYLVDYEGVLPEGTACAYMCSGLTAFSALKKVRADVATSSCRHTTAGPAGS
jgi:D-arabinose 1-dehydrogenase-like Zn-dependent alcohol dehydrogenase